MMLVLFLPYKNLPLLYWQLEWWESTRKIEVWDSLWGKACTNSNEKLSVGQWLWSYSLIETYTAIKKAEGYHLSLSAAGKIKKRFGLISAYIYKCFLIFCIKKSHLLKHPQFFLITFLNVYYIIVLFWVCYSSMLKICKLHSAKTSV